MREGVYSRAWYVLVFFVGVLGLAIAWLALHQRDGFHIRGLVIWTVVGHLVWLGFFLVFAVVGLMATDPSMLFGG